MEQQHSHPMNWNDIYSGEATDYEPPDELMLEIIDTLPPGRALDIGCGAGGLLAALAERGWQVTGVDIAPRAIAAATKVLGARGIDANLYVADAATWEPPESYDLITNSFALPATREEQAAVFRTARAALAAGGTVLLKDFDAGMAGMGPFAAYHCPTVDEVVAAFHGLEILRAEVVETPVHHHAPDDQGRTIWTAVLLHARRPSAVG